MKTTKCKDLLSVLIIAIMIMTAIQPLMTGNNEVESTNLLIDSSELDTFTVNNIADNPLAIEKEDLFSKGSCKSIIVATSDIGELATLLAKYDYNGLIGSQSSNTRGLAFPILEVPESIIPEIEMLSHVYGIYDYHEPIVNSNIDNHDDYYMNFVSEKQDGIIENKLDIEHASYYHGAEAAWENGFTGEGVNIAAITAGIDFGHYELNGRQTINTNASSPYYNYPIAFDSTSMTSYFTDGLPSSYETPGDTWYVNTSNTDLHVYHTVVIDGVNDFWDEKNVPKTIDTYYNMSLTTELKATDPEDDMKEWEFDLSTLNVASDIDNWYVGFSVTPEIESEIKTWKRSVDVNYGLYIDTGAGGATTDPLGNFIDQSNINYVENERVYGMVTENNDASNPFFLNYNGINECTLYRWNITNNITTKLTEGVDYTLDDNSGEVNTIDYIGPLAKGDYINATYNYSHNPEYAIYLHHNGVKWGFEEDGEVWTENNTVEDADFYSWDGAAWNQEELINSTNIQGFGGDFVEFSIPKTMLDNAKDMSLMLFSVGDNKSHAQDTVPGDDNVSFTHPDWGATPTTLTNFTFINEPVEYIVAGIPSASGEYHIGLHPDQSLINNYYGRPAAVLLTDYYESGVYDTVYVDLDNDKCFADEIPMQQYGAYNDTENINPRNGFFRQEDNTVLKDSKYYPINTEKINIQYFDVFNEELTAGAADGDTDFTLANQDITTNPTIQRNYSAATTTEVVNEIVDLTTATTVYYLDNGNIADCRLYYYYPSGSMGWWLTEGIDYTLDYATGRVELDSGGGYVFEEDDTMHAYYNYTTTLQEFVTYSINQATGEITLDNPLTAGDELYALNYTYSVTTILDAKPYISYLGTDYDVELRDWTAMKDVDSDGGVGDGEHYQDISGGMLYYISDGTNTIPYSEVFWDRNGVEEENQRIPGNADMVALFGEYALDSTQGTKVGSTICGMGTGVDNNDNVLIKGMAPEAKLISIRSGNPFEDWYFAVEGYDGEIASGDEAQIVSISNNFGVQETGWDVYTKAADYIGTYYAEGNAIFIAGVGDTGYGYGTASSPGSSDAVITVGVGTQFDYRNYNPKAPSDLARVYADAGPNTHHGEVLPSSSRGPNMLGQPEPDVITAGAFLFASIPLNADQDYTTPDFDWYGGKWAWDLVSGSFISSSSTAGMMALIFDAYYQEHGAYPNAEQARSLLRSGADNMNYDILVQGAGYTNSDRSTKMAADIDGIYLNKTFWVPGDYRGTRYEGFVKLSTPGDTHENNFVLSNKNLTDDATIEVYDAVFDKFDSYEMPFNVTKTYDVKDIPGVINIEPLIPIGTELMKVTITSERKATMQTYMGELFDWTDTNENGEMDFPKEQNRMVYTIGTNHLELRYRDPLGRVHDGLAIQVKGFGGAGEALTDWTIHLDFYEKIDWDWLTLSNTPTTITKGGETSFDASLSIPSDAGVVSYDGAIYIKQSAPEELIATGIGEVMKNVTFKAWFNNIAPSTGYINDSEVTDGDKYIIPQSTIIRWNNTYLYEGAAYYISGTGGSVKFYNQYPIGNAIPKYAEYFNISYLRANATSGIPTENASWGGQTNISNLVKNDYTLRKDGNIWNEVGYVTNENVTWANGGEMIESLSHRYIIRNTCTLDKNGTLWPQYGGETTENFVMAADQNEIFLLNGNIVPGSSKVMLEGKEMAQTGEITILKKEKIETLNSTEIKITNEALSPDLVTWDDMFVYNSIDEPNFKIISYMIYEDGVALTDGLDFNMHVDATHGKFRLLQDPAGHTYNASYVYYNASMNSGQLNHGNVVSESYTVYINGVIVPINKYDLDLVTGVLNLTDELEANEVVDIVYKYNIYKVDVVSGTVTFSNPFSGGEIVDMIYSFYNYTLDLPSGKLTFSSPLLAGDIITANYSYGNFTVNRRDGIVMFAQPLLPGEVVTIEYSHYLSMIPVFINIGANKPDFTFGGTGKGNSLYNHNEITGGYGSGSGDWRYIYMDILEQGIYGLSGSDEEKEKNRVMIDVEWENDLTDVDVQVFGGRTAVPQVFGETMSSDIYGPHSIIHVGGSDETANFFTTTGVSREIVAPQISSGLNVIGLHTVGFNGSVNHTETFTGRVGTMYIDNPSVKIVTNQLVGETQINMNSNMEWSGVGGIAAGPSAPESLKNLTVMQDDPDWSNYDSFEDQLASGTTVYSRTIEDCLIFNAHIWGHDNAPDLDLGVFLDGSGRDEEPDGKVQADEIVAIGADWDADEEVKLIAPKDGTYLIVIYGFALKTVPALFDMDITIVQGTGFGLDGKGENSLPADQKGYFSSNQTEESFNQTYLNLSWDLPGSSTGTLQGALYIGPGNGPMCMLVPIELTIDTDAPLITSPTPSEGAYTNNQKPEIVVSVSDFDRGELVSSSMKVYLDDVDVSMQSSVSIPLIDDTESAVQGYVAGTAAYKPTTALIDGAHVVKTSIMDKAGNIAIKEWAFTVDSSMPSVEINYPAESVSYVNTDSIIVTGTAEAGLDLEIVGTTSAELMFGNNGAFYVDIALSEGENSFIIRATDLAGNTIGITRTVHMDNDIPEMDSVRFSTGYITNEPLTTISGSISEMGTLMIDGIPITVNSDGTFSYMISLIEGVNTIHLEFADMAGNVQHDWYNVTLDTVAPVISLSTNTATVYNSSFELIGTVEAGAEVFVNGKRTTVGTRQSGEFSTILTLSPDMNNIVIEAEDSAGNIAQYTHTVEYDMDYDARDVNWGAIGLMITLLVVGLVLGLLFGGMLLGGREPEDEYPMDEIPPEEADMDGEVPEDVDMEDIPEEDMPMEGEVPEDADMEDIPEEDEFPEEQPDEVDVDSDDSGLEEVPDEDMPMDEEIPEDTDMEDIPEEDELPSDDNLMEEFPEEQPDEVGELPEELPEGAEPIPDEEEMPEDISEEVEEPEEIAEEAP